jgi:ABC-type glutathione transport system ATPase component
MTPLLEVRGLTKRFGAHVVLDGVDLDVGRGEIVALVGESGSGKSTIARVLARLERADAGRAALDGAPFDLLKHVDVTRAYRARVQMVFQDPFGSLNPVHTVGEHLTRPLRLHGRTTPQGERSAALALLESVGLAPAAEFIDVYPHALSGGQRQRVAIARALAPQPALLIADEPTSMLDVSIRAGVLALLRGLRDQRGVSMLLITHDLASARALADRILVLSAGRIVESGPTERVISAPEHPYTQQLLAAVPGAGPLLRRPHTGAPP